MKSILILACLAVIFFTLNADAFSQCAKGKCGITERQVVKSAVIVTVIPATTAVATEATETRRPVRTTLKAAVRLAGKVAIKPVRLLRRK